MTTVHAPTRGALNGTERGDAHDQCWRRGVRLPSARPRDRGAGGLPDSPGRGPRQLGPPSRGRYRRQAEGHYLRQPRCRCLHRGHAEDHRGDGRDAITFIRALGFDQVDLFGFSMGGMIAQVIAQQHPQLVRKMIIAGTGPAGGKGSTR
jgi:pimeloyl-ACP methyl ester carboxylesterase